MPKKKQRKKEPVDQLHQGNLVIDLPPGRNVVSVTCSDVFHAYALDADGIKTELLGPLSVGARSFKIKTGSIPSILIETKGVVSHHVQDSTPKPLDSTPIEVILEKPLSLREEIQRYIREEVSSYAASHQGTETFEEADDFDIEDDFDAEVIFSQHELTELQELESLETELDGSEATDNPIGS